MSCKQSLTSSWTAPIWMLGRLWETGASRVSLQALLAWHSALSLGRCPRLPSANPASLKQTPTPASMNWTLLLLLLLLLLFFRFSFLQLCRIILASVLLSSIIHSPSLFLFFTFHLFPVLFCDSLSCFVRLYSDLWGSALVVCSDLSCPAVARRLGFNWSCNN